MRRLLAAVLAAALLGLSGCGTAEPEPSPSESLAPSPSPTAEPSPFALGYDPAASLHPITGDSRVNVDLAALMYQGLFELDNSFTSHPLLAERADMSEDGLVWTITLKAGTCFSDGTPLTAQHAADSLNAARTSSRYGTRLRDVTAVTAGEGTVTVTLSAPNGALPALLDIPVVLERENGLPLGTGRYCWSGTEEAPVLTVNPHYPRAGSLPFREIGLTPVSTADDRIAAFDSGMVTAVTTDFSASYALGYSGSYESYDYPTTELFYVGFRCTGGPCGSAEVRRAFSMALDREKAVSVTLAGHGDASALPVPPGSGGYDEAAASALAYDPEAAASLLSQAGYARGEDGALYMGRQPLAVTLVVNSDSAAKQALADAFAEELTGLGAVVTVDKLPWTDYLAALSAGRFDLYIGEVRLPGDLDPGALLTGELNYGGYAGAALGTALAEWQAARGKARDTAGETLWRAFAEEAPFAAVCFKRGSLLVRWGQVSNLRPTRADPFCRMEEWTAAGTNERKGA